MQRIWLFGGLIGLGTMAATVASIAFPHARPGTSESVAVAATGHAVAGTNAAANANGVNGDLNDAANSHQHPNYRNPIGSPYPNPPSMPGHIRPYLAHNNSMYLNAKMNGMRIR
jgi:hypothetical protein